jgi:hypothetical protein
MPTRKPKPKIERRQRGLVIKAPTARPIDDAVFNPFREAKQAESRANSPHGVEQDEINAPGEIIAQGATNAPSVINRAPVVKPSPGEAVSPSALLARIVNPQQHTRMPNDLLDHVLRELLPSEQLILLRVYRLTRGHHKDEITVSYDTLAKACNLTRRTAIKSVQRLEREGLVERTGTELKTIGNLNRGVTIRMLIPSATNALGAKSSPSAFISPGAANAPNKDKEIKKDKKGSELALDTKDCPDCHGTGFWYPEGVEKGVTKCHHEKLLSPA